MTKPRVRVGDAHVSIEDIAKIAADHADVALNTAPDFRRRIDAGPAFVDCLLEEDGVILRRLAEDIRAETWTLYDQA